MATEAQVIAQYGIKRPDVTIHAAREAGLELAVACAMLMGESGGGRMVWGSDGVATGNAYQKGGPVTRENYLAYRALMRAGKIGRQGVGDSQLTSAEFQDRGDQLGGCWDPHANQLAGFIGLANRIDTYGLRDGLRRYNGSGPAAEAYATKRVAEAATWRARLAGATQEDQLSAQFEADQRARWGREDLLERDLRADLAAKQKQINQLLAGQDAQTKALANVILLLTSADER